MLGGLIAGALGGGATAMSGLADQIIKEAQLAKEQAYKEGLLKWELDERRKDAETQRGFQKDMATLENDNANARMDKEFEFRAGQTDKQIAAELKAAGMRASGGGSDKIPTPVVIGETFDPVTQRSEKIYGIPARGQDGRVVYLDPISGQPVSQGGATTTTSGSGAWNVNDAIKAASAGQGTANPGQSRVTPPASNSTTRQAQPKSYQQFVQEGRDRKAQQQAENERNRLETEERRRLNGGQDY